MDFKKLLDKVVELHERYSELYYKRDAQLDIVNSISKTMQESSPMSSENYAGAIARYEEQMVERNRLCAAASEVWSELCTAMRDLKRRMPAHTSVIHDGYRITAGSEITIEKTEDVQEIEKEPQHVLTG